MRYLWLTEGQARKMIDQATTESPSEACGLILGRGGRATEIVPVPNVSDYPTRHYVMDPLVLSQQLPTLDSRGLSLIGFYHSHPTSDPIPSPLDVRESHYPDTAYVIVGLRGAEARLAAWLINAGEVQRLPLHIGDQAPQDLTEDTTLSDAQRMAVLVSALLAFIILIAWSVALLPPAPAIPG